MLSEHIKMALSSVRSARFRSFFTMFGVIIGVVSVITTASIGEGIKHQVSGQAQTVGQDLVTVRPGKLVERDNQGDVTKVNLLSFLTSSSITDKDLETITKDSHVEQTVPISVISGVASLGDKRFNEAFIMATNDHFPEMVAQKVEFGNFFSESDSHRRVAIIGKNVAEQLFQENVPVSKSMQIRGQEFVVSGVFERVAANPLSPETDYNNAIFIPYDAAKTLTNNDLTPYEVLIRPKSKDVSEVDKTISSITSGLKENHGGEEDFTVLRQQDMLAVTDNLLELITKSVAVMAGVALFVGGVGIMNVMLVSVTERTREIGIRKTVGATNRQIQSQFLIEAIVLSVWGAAVGIALSGFINVLFRVFTELQPVITWQMALIAAAVAIAVGIVFGIIPAIKAARKDPIEALRTE